MQTIGLDLGTTNSVLAVGGEAVPLESEQGSSVLPSVVAYPPNGKTLIGAAARRRRAIDGRNTIWSSKRLIGRTWHAEEAQRVRERYPFELTKNEADEIAYRTRAGLFTPTEIGTTILHRLLEHTELNPAATPAAVGVPSAFSSAHRSATLAAARSAGLGQIDLVDEPVATVLAYREALEALELAAVYDLGGGTFELAVVDCRKRPLAVLANRGDLYLGGDDIDHAIGSWVADQVLSEHRWDLRDNPLIFDRLVAECERAKVRLCFASQTTIDLARVDPAVPGGGGSVLLGADRLEGLASDLVRRSFVICDAVMAESGVRVDDLDAVFLAGGTTQLPMVRAAVADYFKQSPRAEFDPMEVVAIGASIAAASRE